MSINRSKVLDKAQKYVQQGKLAKAVEEYNLLVEDDPTDVRTMLKVGDLYARMGNIESGLDTYRRVADFYSKDGFFLKAVAVYKQMLKLDPSSIPIYTQLAQLYSQLGLNNEAMKQFQIVAKHYETKGMKKESLDIYKKIAELDPDNTASRIKLAELYVREGHNDQALKDLVKIAEELKAKGSNEDLIKIYEKIIKLEADNIQYVRDLAGLYLEINEPKRALAKLQVCFKQDAKNEKTLTLLARAFIDLQQPEKARAVYTELLGIYQEKGMTDKAQIIKAKLVGEAALDASDPMLSSKVSINNNVSSAVPPPPAGTPAVMNNVTAALDDPAEKLLTDVEVYMRYGLADKAIQAMMTALKQNPNMPMVRQKLTEVYLTNNDTKSAAAALMQIHSVAREQKDSTMEMSLLGEILSFDSENQQALQRLNELQSEMMQSPSDGVSNVSSAASSGDFVSGLNSPTEFQAVMPPEMVVDAAPEDEVVVEEEVVVDAVEVPVVEIAEEADASIIALSQAGDGDVAASEDFELAPEEHHGIEADSVIEISDLEGEMLRGDEAENDVSKSQFQFLDEISGIKAKKPAPSKKEEVAPPAKEESIQLEEEFSTVDLGEMSANAPLQVDAADVAVDLSDDVSLGLSGDHQAIDLSGDFAGEVGVEIESSLANSAADVVEGFDLAGDMQPEVPEVVEVKPPPPVAKQPQPPTKAPIAKPAAPSAPTVKDPHQQELEEASFFVRQGLNEEAAEIVRQVLQAAPTHPKALEIADKIGLNAVKPVAEPVKPAAPAAKVPPVATPKPAITKDELSFANEMERNEEPEISSADFFDLADELKDEIDNINNNATRNEEEEPPTFDEVFAAFKKGVQQTVSEDETEAHYNLGIAYKEMGLLDDAISEFRIALKDVRLMVDACSLIGICFREQGRHKESEASFQKAIETLAPADERVMGLKYELGETYVAAGHLKEALMTFKEVYQSNQSFRDVSHRMKELAGRLEGGVADESLDLANPAEAQKDAQKDVKKKSKISYL